MNLWDVFGEIQEILIEMGGPRSGHRGHKGRKGKRGGSAPSKGAAAPWLGGVESVSDIRQILGKEPTMEDIQRWSKERKEAPPPGYVAPEGPKPTVSKPTPIKEPTTPTVTRPEDLDVNLIVPSPNLSQFQIDHIRERIEIKRADAIKASTKVDAARTVGTIKKWHKRRKEAEREIHDLVARLEGRK